MSNGDVNSQAHGAYLQLLQEGNEYARTTNHNVNGVVEYQAMSSRNNKDFDSRNNFINRK